MKLSLQHIKEKVLLITVSMNFGFKIIWVEWINCVWCKYGILCRVLSKWCLCPINQQYVVNSHDIAWTLQVISVYTKEFQEPTHYPTMWSYLLFDCLTAWWFFYVYCSYVVNLIFTDFFKLVKHWIFLDSAVQKSYCCCCCCATGWIPPNQQDSSIWIFHIKFPSNHPLLSDMCCMESNNNKHLDNYTTFRL